MDEDAGRPAPGAPPWSAPELAAAAVLAAVGVLALGGLAMGIDVAATTASPYPGSLVDTWDSITYGASWTGPVLAMAVLAVAGLCWWQADRWAEDAADGSPAADDAGAGDPTTDDEADHAAGTARWYVARAMQLALWALAALALVALASLALLAAVVGIDVAAPVGQQGWARVIGVSADALAVLVVSGCGAAVARSALRIGAALR